MATILENYYSNLLITQYKRKPKDPSKPKNKAQQTIELLARLAVFGELPKKVEKGFDPDTAVGPQLDIIGKFYGVDRIVPRNNNKLNDDDFRTVLKIKAITNTLGSSLKDIRDFLSEINKDRLLGGDLIITDPLRMSIRYTGNLVVSQNLFNYLDGSNILPRPTGVSLSLGINRSDQTTFTFKKYGETSDTGTGFNTYDNIDSTKKWGTYDT